MVCLYPNQNILSPVFRLNFGLAIWRIRGLSAVEHPPVSIPTPSGGHPARFLLPWGYHPEVIR